VCFEHCAGRYLRPYSQLFRGFELVRYPTYCPDDRALRRHIHSFPPQYPTVTYWLGVSIPPWSTGTVMLKLCTQFRTELCGSVWSCIGSIVYIDIGPFLQEYHGIWVRSVHPLPACICHIANIGEPAWGGSGRIQRKIFTCKVEWTRSSRWVSCLVVKLWSKAA